MSRPAPQLSWLISVFLLLNLTYQGVLGDDRIRYDWVNASTLQTSLGYNAVVQDNPTFNLILCNFDPTDRRYVNCQNAISVSSTMSQINPYGISTGTTGTSNYYGVWLQSQRGTWEDKVFGQTGTQFNVANIITIADHKLLSGNNFFMYLQPKSTDFPTVTMRLYLTCDNGTTYIGGMMDLSSFIASQMRATYENSVYQLTNGCHQACAEIYIGGIQRSNNFPHQFRAGHICGSLMDGAVSVVANTFGLVTMLVILIISAHV